MQDTNYSDVNDEVYYAFQQTGDFGYPNFLEDLEQILNSSVRVSLIYGDADYIVTSTQSTITSSFR